MSLAVGIRAVARNLPSIVDAIASDEGTGVTFAVAIHYPVKPATGFWVAQRFIAAICALIEGAAPFRFERGATELSISWVLISMRS